MCIIHTACRYLIGRIPLPLTRATTTTQLNPLVPRPTCPALLAPRSQLLRTKPLNLYHASSQSRITGFCCSSLHLHPRVFSTAFHPNCPSCDKATERGYIDRYSASHCFQRHSDSRLLLEDQGSEPTITAKTTLLPITRITTSRDRRHQR